MLEDLGHEVAGVGRAGGSIASDLGADGVERGRALGLEQCQQPGELGAQLPGHVPWRGSRASRGGGPGVDWAISAGSSVSKGRGRCHASRGPPAECWRIRRRGRRTRWRAARGRRGAEPRVRCRSGRRRTRRGAARRSRSGTWRCRCRDRRRCRRALGGRGPRLGEGDQQPVVLAGHVGEDRHDLAALAPGVSVRRVLVAMQPLEQLEELPTLLGGWRAV